MKKYLFPIAAGLAAWYLFFKKPAALPVAPSPVPDPYPPGQDPLNTNTGTPPMYSWG